MPWIPHKKVKGKHYDVYTESGKAKVPTKSALGKQALKVALKEGVHLTELDFIPAKFTLQLHGWLSADSDLKNLKDVQRVIKQSLKSGGDPLKAVDSHKAKCHWDLRVQKVGGSTWFGQTFFRAPWTGTADNKVQGEVKGYQVLVPGGKKLAKFLAERAQKELAANGVAERMDRIEWMKVKGQWFLPNSPGNPTKKLPAFMIAIEFYEPAVIHRRELDFFDITYFGKYLKGRYFNRLVERKLKDSEMTVYQKKAGKPVYGLYFYFWKSKQQWGDKGTPYTMKDLLACSERKKTLKPIPIK